MKIVTKNLLIPVTLAVSCATLSEGFAPQAVTPLAKTHPSAATMTMKRPLVSPLSMASMQQQGEGEEEQDGMKPGQSIPNSVGRSTDKKKKNKSGIAAATAGAALVAALTMAPMASDAAMSGGRMGGSSFTAPSVSRSYSAPSYSRGYSRSYRPSTTIIAPTMPLVAPISPFYNPYSYGYGSPGVIAYNRGPGILPLLALGGMFWAVSSAVNSIGRSAGGPLNFFEDRNSDSVLGSGTSVVKMSVALDVSNRDDPNSILSVLDRLSNTARTDSRVGIQNLSSQVALELLRRKSSIIGASTKYQHYRNRDKAQREFNSLSVQERGKFEQEAISKFGGVDYGTARSSSSNSGGFNDLATKAVVTLVLAIDGESKVPNIQSVQDVEDALRRIASDVKVSDCLQGAEILWTPEDRTETLTMREVIADYPELNSV